MKARLITFSDDTMSTSRRHCVGSAVSEGGIDDPRSYTSWNISGEHDGVPEIRNLYRTHKSLFDAPRGCGYWAWKPVIIYHYGLRYPQRFGIDEGDVIVYADAGVEFVNNVSHIINRMDQDIFLFGNNWEHAHWCKRDVIDYIMPGAPWEAFGKQAQASVIFFRVSDCSRKFVAEWLKWCLHRERFSTICTDEWRYLIDDSPSVLPNHPEFREHRHDQAILTTLAYREGIKLHYWPAQYNDGAFSYEKLPEYAADDYPILFHHHRKRNHEWQSAA